MDKRSAIDREDWCDFGEDGDCRYLKEQREKAVALVRDMREFIAGVQSMNGGYFWERQRKIIKRAEQFEEEE